MKVRLTAYQKKTLSIIYCLLYMCHGFFKLLISTLHYDTAGKCLYIWKFYIFLTCPPIAQHTSCKYLHETIKRNAVVIGRKGKRCKARCKSFSFNPSRSEELWRL